MEGLLLMLLVFVALLALLSAGAWVLAIGLVAVFLGMVPWPWLLLAAVVYVSFQLLGGERTEELRDHHCTCHPT